MPRIVKARRNPAPSSAELEKAARLFEDFSGIEADAEAQELEFPAPPAVGVAIGRVVGLIYETERVERGKIKPLTYQHIFKKQSRPLFVVSPDGSQLLLIGGSYNFTDRGIVDK